MISDLVKFYSQYSKKTDDLIVYVNMMIFSDDPDACNCYYELALENLRGMYENCLNELGVKLSDEQIG